MRDGRASGWVSGFIGMAIFSGSLPATRVAVAALDPLFLTAARAALAGLVSVAALALLREKRPARADLLALVGVALGVVVGFPLLTALALRHVSAAHSVVFVGLLPLTTALFAVALGGERPRRPFWLFSGLGAALVAGFALTRAGAGSLTGDALMVAAILVCGYGYAEGAKLSRRLGGWQVISWALTLSLPLAILASLWLWPRGFDGVGLPAWLGLAYVSLFSMWLGFVFWYRGLALGGVAAVGQLQLLQPFLSLILAAALLGERVDAAMLATAALVVACVAGAKRYA